jgi:hypothetical protein
MDMCPNSAQDLVCWLTIALSGGKVKLWFSKSKSSEFQPLAER